MKYGKGRSTNFIRWFIIIAFLLIAFRTARLFQDIGRPFPNFITYYNPHIPGYAVDAYSLKWWLPEELSFPYNGHILSVDGQTYTEAWAADYYQTVFDEGKRHIQLVLRHDGGAMTTHVLPLQRFTLTQAVDMWAAKFLLGLGLLILSWELNKVGDENPICRIMAISGTWVALSSAIQHPSLFWHDGVVSVFYALLILIIPPFAASSIVDFSLAFPHGHTIKTRWLQGLVWAFRIWVISAGIAHLIATSYILLGGEPRHVLGLDTHGYTTANLGTSFAILLEMILPTVVYLREPRWRRRLFIIIASVLPSIPLIFISNAQRLAGSTASIFDLGFDLHYPLLLLPLSLAYLVLRYQTFRTASLFMLNVPVLAFAGLSASLLTAFLRTRLAPGEVWDIPLFIWLFALAAICIWGGLLQSHIKNGLVWLLNHNTLGYQEIRQFSQALALADARKDEYMMPVPDYTPLIASVAQSVQVNYAALWLMVAQDEFIRLHGEYRAESVSKTLIAPVDILPWQPSLAVITPQSMFFAQDKGIPVPIENLLVGAAEVALPLFSQDQLIGIVTLGHRYDNDIFDANEVNVMRVILSWVSLYLQDKTNLRERRLAEVSREQTRRDFNKRLDNILHDIMSGKMRQVRQTIDLAVRADPNNAIMEIQQQVGHLQQMIKNFRNLTQINQNQINLGIELKHMCIQMQGNQTVVYTGVDTLKQPLSPTLYQDVLLTATELLNNALTHAKARLIEVVLEDSHDDYFTLMVKDDGVGSSEEQRQNAAKHGHYGVQSLPQRFERWDGTVEYTSEPGKGTRVTITIPYQSAL